MAKKDKEKQEDISTTLLMREVDEEVRAERMQQWWQRFGSTLVSAIVAIVLATVGYEIWQNHQQTQAEEVTVAMLTAKMQADEGNPLIAAQSLAELQGKSALAQLQTANYYREVGESEKAAGLYEKIMQRKDAPALASYAALRLNRTDAIYADAPFYVMAQEKEALKRLDEGKVEEARTIISSLLERQNLPASLRQRLSELLQYTP